MEMLRKDDVRDRSIPMDLQTKQFIEDLSNRYQRAIFALEAGQIGYPEDSDRYKHLSSKIEGLKLALSYVDDEVRLDRMNEGRDHEVHGDAQREGHPERSSEGASRAAGARELDGDPRAEQG